MFERRLKIILMILLVFILVLVARAVQLQIVEREDWAKKAAETMRSETLAETSRGRILDCKGAVLAEDQPCIDACVDYRIIEDPPDPVFLNQMAVKRAKDRYGDEYRHASGSQRIEMVKNEQSLLESQIQTMWDKLASLSNGTKEEIDDRRHSIQQRIWLRRRMIWVNKYEKLRDDHSVKADLPWYRKWISGDETGAPNIDDISDVELNEERTPHVILEAIDVDTQNELQKHADQYPGLSLVPSTHRAYPYGAAACHVIGHLGRVWKEDITDDPNLGDELRAYGPTDQKGRDGLEALGEPTLRGVRGLTVYDGQSDQIVSQSPPRPGGDLHSTLDIDLQMEIEEMFTHVKVPWEMRGEPKDWQSDEVNMHGAAVVIEIETGNVRALVSSPGFDLNDLDKNYPLLLSDRLDAPLLNRATQAMLEPGSTVKPVVGAGAITDHLLGVNEGIECTGFLKIGTRVYKGFGKCWTFNTARINGLDYFRASSLSIRRAASRA